MSELSKNIILITYVSGHHNWTAASQLPSHHIKPKNEQNNLAISRIVVLSPLTAKNAFTHHVVCWADTLTSGSRWTMCTALMYSILQWVGTCPLKSALPVGDLDLIYGSFGSHKSSPKRHVNQFSLFAQLIRVPNTHTQTDRKTDRPCVQVISPKSWKQSIL